MAQEFSTLETNILKAKGLTAPQLTALCEAGIASRADLLTVGDAATLVELVAEIDPGTAAKVIQWATGKATDTKAPAPAPAPNVLLESAGPVQAVPVLSCYWCGAESIPTSELELGILLRREGLSKEEIPKKLIAMSAAEKDSLWVRVRKLRG